MSAWINVINFISLCFLVGCSCGGSMLSVQTEYLSHESLASYYVGTPDPRLNHPNIGQRLIISWNVPKYYLCLEDLHLDVTIRFRTRQEITEKVPITSYADTYIYSLMNCDYIATQGILTYKVDLVGGGAILEEWRHQIWTDLVIIEDSESEEETGEEIDLDEDFEEDDD